MKRHEISAILLKTGRLLYLKKGNVFEYQAYERVANDVLGIASINQFIASLSPNFQSKLQEIIETGSLKLKNELEQELHLEEDFFAVFNIHGLGFKRIKVLFDAYHFSSFAKLEELALTHQLQKVKGFSAKMEENILMEINRIRIDGQKMFYFEAEEVFSELETYIQNNFSLIKTILPTGEFRRRKSLIDKLEIVLVSEESFPVILKHLSAEIIDEKNEIGQFYFQKKPIIFYLAMPTNVYQKLFLSTGNVDHLRDVLNYFSEQKFPENLNSEEAIYQKVGINFLVPELRENLKSIAEIKESGAPNIISPFDIHGDFHMHTVFSDGKNTLEEMVAACENRGYKYMAITDHSQSLKVANGLSPERLFHSIELIQKLQKRYKIKIFTGAEVDILEDGTLDYSDDILKELDIVICSIHSKFNLPKEKQTERILKAMDNPYFRILGHPTGIILKTRAPLAFDLEAVLQKAKAKNIVLELNANPTRLDLSYENCYKAKTLGIKIAISSDAHSVSQLGLINYGVNEARRGWLTARDIFVG